MLRALIKYIFRPPQAALLISIIALCASLWGLMVVENQLGLLQRLLGALVACRYGILDDDVAGGESYETQAENYPRQL